jgi:hypothetical protein
MGAGKTLTVLSAFRAQQLIERTYMVVVAPLRVAVTQCVWQEDARRWGVDLSFSLVWGNAVKRRRAIETVADVYVTTYDSLDTKEMQELLARPGGWLVLDETTYVKAFTDRFKAIRPHADTWQKRVGLTGTPAPNGAADIFYQVQSLDGGLHFGTNKQKFLDKNFYPTDYHRRKWAPLSREDLYGQISDIVHRVDESEVSLPALVVQKIAVEQPDVSRETYMSMLKLLKADIAGGEITAANAAVRSNKLRQICSGFLYAGEDDRVVRLDSKRLTALASLMFELEEPLVVFYDFIADKEAILAVFPKAITLEDEDAVGRWNRGEVELLLMHPRSGGHGLNLQHGGHHVVWFSLPWSLELWKQANARLARPGQAHSTVFAHVLLIPGTIEDHVYRTLCEKEQAELHLLDWFADQT